MTFIVRPLCVAYPREMDGDTLVLRLPPDIGTSMTAVVTECGGGLAQAFYGNRFRVSRLVPLRTLLADEEHAARAEGRSQGNVRAIVPGDKPEHTWDVADVLDARTAPIDRVLAAVMSAPRGGQ